MSMDIPPMLAFFVTVGAITMFLVVMSGTRTFIGSLTPSQRAGAFYASVVASMATMFGMGLIDEHIRTKEAVYGVVSLELAFSNARAKAILDSWSPQQKVWAGFSLGTDHLFMAVYSTALALGCLHVGRGSDAAIQIASLQYIAAISDFLEGMFLLAVLVHSDGLLDERLIVGAGVCATIKFALIALGMLYMLVMFLLQRMTPGKRSD